MGGDNFAGGQIFLKRQIRKRKDTPRPFDQEPVLGLDRLEHRLAFELQRSSGAKDDR
jgi:hypothetical protein